MTSQNYWLMWIAIGPVLYVLLDSLLPRSLTVKRIGGITFLKLDSLSVSFCVSKKGVR